MSAMLLGKRAVRKQIAKTNWKQTQQSVESR